MNTHSALTHLALHVKDLQACIDFYTDYAGMQLVHDRVSNSKRVVWLAEPGKESEFILVVLPGGPGRNQSEQDFSHLGFALSSREAVDEIAARAGRAGILEWEPRQEPYPVGYYCGVRDPDGNFVEFSFGQPLGPGAEQPRRSLQPFHLAIPVRDIDEARRFYGVLLGCAEGRSADGWVDFDFFGHQLVCHLVNDIAGSVHNEVNGHAVPVPHFGAVLDLATWQTLADELKARSLDFVIEPQIRFEGQTGEQATMFLLDPSGNSIEFKAFANIATQLFATEKE